MESIPSFSEYGPQGNRRLRQSGAETGVIAGHQRLNVSRSVPLSVRVHT
jgi:hypothetical protein